MPLTSEEIAAAKAMLDAADRPKRPNGLAMHDGLCACLRCYVKRRR